MSKQSGKIRAMERRQAVMEDQLDKLSQHQDLHGRQLLLVRLQLKKTNEHLVCIREKFMGTREGKRGIFDRLRTLEVRQKTIIGIASLIFSACVVGLIKAIC